jgi:two-component system chemotaxis response regulator CheY
MKVMLVDDSSTMRKIQKRVLLEIDPEIEIIEAGNGKEALEKLSDYNNDFSFMLLDINMPEMNGMETLKAIRSNPDTAKIPVIMCTSVAEKGQVMEAIKAGASNYLVKPFQPDDLRSKISTVLGK